MTGAFYRLAKGIENGRRKKITLFAKRAFEL